MTTSLLSLTDSTMPPSASKLSPETQIRFTKALILDNAQHFGIKPDAWEPVALGIGNTVVRLSEAGNAFYLKYYNSRHRLEKLNDEISLVLHAQAAGLPVPQFMTTTASDLILQVKQADSQHYATITKEIMGIHPTAYSTSFLGDLAVAHASMHTLHLERSHAPPLNIKETYHFADTSSSATLRAVDRRADRFIQELAELWRHLPQGLCHLDITRQNILVNQGQLAGVIDFEDSSMAPYLFCLAGTLWDIQESSSGDPQAYLAMYDQRRSLTALEQTVLPKFIFLRGWLALHGTLLTDRSQEKIDVQLALLHEFE